MSKISIEDRILEDIDITKYLHICTQCRTLITKRDQFNTLVCSWCGSTNTRKLRKETAKLNQSKRQNFFQHEYHKQPSKTKPTLKYLESN